MVGYKFKIKVTGAPGTMAIVGVCAVGQYLELESGLRHGLHAHARRAARGVAEHDRDDVALAHAANEWLPLDELVHAAEVYTHLIATKLASTA